MRVLAVQKKTLGTPAENLERVRRMLEDAAAPDVIVLPEIFTCPYDNSCFPVFAQEEGGEVCRELFPKDKPVLMDYSCGHERPTISLPLGANVRLDTAARTLSVL